MQKREDYRAFLKYIDDYYYQLNIALVKSDFEYDYSFGMLV